MIAKMVIITEILLSLHQDLEKLIKSSNKKLNGYENEKDFMDSPDAGGTDWL